MWSPLENRSYPIMFRSTKHHPLALPSREDGDVESSGESHLTQLCFDQQKHLPLALPSRQDGDVESSGESHLTQLCFYQQDTFHWRCPARQDGDGWSSGESHLTHFCFDSKNLPWACRPSQHCELESSGNRSCQSFCKTEFRLFRLP